MVCSNLNRFGLYGVQLQKILFVMCILLCSTFAKEEKSHSYKNALGWDGGLTYRRYFNDGLYLSSSINGSFNKREGYDTSSNTRSSENPANELYMSRSSDGLSYSSFGKITTRLSKELFMQGPIAVSSFISGSFSYKRSTSNNTSSMAGVQQGLDIYNNDEYGLGMSIGFEPNFWLYKRFHLGMLFGLQYNFTYTARGSKKTFNGEVMDEYSETKNADTAHRIDLFGAENFVPMKLQLYALYLF
jgi:hypothetical protein